MINKQCFKIKKDKTAYRNCYCRYPELIENYEAAIADDTQVWVCHHRLETHNSDGERRLVDISKAELIALGMYYDRPPEELIFLSQVEHVKLHNTGRKFSEECRVKMSIAQSCKKLSEVHKAKISKTMKGHKVSEETKLKMSAARKAYWIAKEKQKLS